LIVVFLAIGYELSEQDISITPSSSSCFRITGLKGLNFELSESFFNLELLSLSDCLEE